QHDLNGEDVAGGVPLGEAVGTARVVGDVAADGARLLGRRVRCEVEAVGGGGVTQVEVDDPGADPGGAVVRVDVDLLHGGGHDHDPTLGGTGTGGETGAGAAGDDRRLRPLGDADHLGHLGGVLGEGNGERLAAHQRRVLGVEVQLQGLDHHVVVTESGPKLADDVHAGRLPRVRCAPPAATRGEHDQSVAGADVDGALAGQPLDRSVGPVQPVLAGRSRTAPGETPGGVAS